MATTPLVNPLAIQTIRCATGISANVGCGVRFTGSSGATWLEVTTPQSRDGRIEGVIIEATATDSVTSKMVQVGISNVQLRAASAVAFGDPVRIADAQGRWETGNALNRNNYYVAMQAAAMTGDLFWARPILGEDRPRKYAPGTIRSGTGAAENIAHGLGSAPTVVRYGIVGFPAGISFAAAVEIVPGTHTATNVVLTAPANVKYWVEAEVY